MYIYGGGHDEGRGEHVHIYMYIHRGGVDEGRERRTATQRERDELVLLYLH